MYRKVNASWILAHGVLLLLIGVLLFVPKQRPTVRQPWSMIAVLVLIEVIFLVRYRKNRAGGSCQIALFLWALLLLWELCTSVLDTAHPVLVPCPENVFDTFREQGKLMLVNLFYSLELLVIGFGLGMSLAVGMGLVAGWFPGLRNFLYPIANVMAPIPPIVISPYLVALMPSFRSASALVILLGVFWPNFLSTINRVRGIDRRILDSARMLNLSNISMITQVLFPYVLPGIISGLKVSLTTSLLMLNFAELMGAAHGMGYYVQNSITYANYTHAAAGIIWIGIVVTFLNQGVQLIQEKTIAWK